MKKGLFKDENQISSTLNTNTIKINQTTSSIKQGTSAKVSTRNSNINVGNPIVKSKNSFIQQKGADTYFDRDKFSSNKNEPINMNRTKNSILRTKTLTKTEADNVLNSLTGSLLIQGNKNQDKPETKKLAMKNSFITKVFKRSILDKSNNNSFDQSVISESIFSKNSSLFKTEETQTAVVNVNFNKEFENLVKNFKDVNEGLKNYNFNGSNDLSSIKENSCMLNLIEILLLNSNLFNLQCIKNVKLNANNINDEDKNNKIPMTNEMLAEQKYIQNSSANRINTYKQIFKQINASLKEFDSVYQKIKQKSNLSFSQQVNFNFNFNVTEIKLNEDSKTEKKDEYDRNDLKMFSNSFHISSQLNNNLNLKQEPKQVKFFIHAKEENSTSFTIKPIKKEDNFIANQIEINNTNENVINNNKKLVTQIKENGGKSSEKKVKIFNQSINSNQSKQSNQSKKSINMKNIDQQAKLTNSLDVINLDDPLFFSAHSNDIVNSVKTMSLHKKNVSVSSANESRLINNIKISGEIKQNPKYSNNKLTKQEIQKKVNQVVIKSDSGEIKPLKKESNSNHKEIKELIIKKKITDENSEFSSSSKQESSENNSEESSEEESEYEDENNDLIKSMSLDENLPDTDEHVNIVSLPKIKTKKILQTKSKAEFKKFTSKKFGSKKTKQKLDTKKPSIKQNNNIIVEELDHNGQLVIASYNLIEKKEDKHRLKLTHKSSTKSELLKNLELIDTDANYVSD